MTDVVFATSDICTTFEHKTIGSKVKNIPEFMEQLRTLVRAHDGSKDRAPGQHFIVMPDAHHLVSAGDGPKSENAEDYIVRHHREGPKMFLKREKAGNVQFLAAVVYTREAYLADPDVTKEEAENLGDATHMIVAVIASSGPAAPVTPFRFVHNLAGGNNEYKRPEEPEDAGMDAGKVWRYVSALNSHIDWLESKAKEVTDYWANYNVVAD